MLTAIIDYESGNLHSASKACARMAAEHDAGSVIVTQDADVVARADRIVLPGTGRFRPVVTRSWPPKFMRRCVKPLR